MTGAVLWDLDGTLIDSEKFHWLSWRDTMAAEGVPITYEQFADSFGHRNDEILPHWLGDGATAERIARISLAKESLYRDMILAEGLKPLAGAAPWVETLHHDKWSQAIASSAPRANIDVVLEVLGFTQFFQAIVSSEDVVRGKPDPQVFLLAAERVTATADRCIVVEDSPAGVEGSRRAGMRSIGVNAVKALSADLVVPSLADLPDDAFRSLLATAPASGS